MLRRLVLALAVVLTLFVPSFHAGAHPSPVPATEQHKDCVVYVTRTGHRYHHAWCRYLRYSRIPMTRGKAIGEGYTPCHVCGGSDCDTR